MRRSTRVVAGVVAVIAVAGGSWWLRDRSASSQGSAATAAAPSSGVVQRGLPQRGETDEPAAMPLDADPAAALRLEGQVVDGDSHGVGGAIVALSASPPRTVVTEADGSFVFDHLIGRSYVLIARAAHSVAGPIAVRLTDRSDPVVLRLRPAATLTVTVVRGDATPVDGAIVELRGIDDQRAVVKNKVAVFSPVVPGGYQIAAWADGMARAFQRIHVGSGDTEARLVLSPGAPVLGRVVDDRGEGIAGARVRYSGASDQSQQADDRRDGTTTGADGSFRFAALPAGSFRFIASHAERASGTSALVTLDGTTERAGIVIAMPIGAVVRGRVVDDQHHPVGSARVTIGPAVRDSGMADDAVRQTYSDVEGKFEITGLPRARLSALAHHEIGASHAVPLDARAGDVTDLTLTIDVTGTIAGIVVDPLGQPVEGAQVMPGRSFQANRELFDAGRGRLGDLPQARADASGKFALTGLAPGRYRLLVVPASRVPGASDIRNGVTASTGDSNVRLVVTPDGGVKGRVAFSDGSAPDLFSVAVDQNQRSSFGGDGSFHLDGLAPATYKLEIRGPGFEMRTVEVVIEPSKITDAGTITVARGRSIAGIVVADGEPVAGAKVSAGRAVFGSGTSSSQSDGAPPVVSLGEGTKTTTTDASGRFSLSGLGGGDVTLIAEQEAIGRSRALRLPAAMPGQTELTIALEKFGALRGTLHQAGPPAGGVAVTCQSTSTPGAVFRVMAGPDGAFRFDRLAPDVYKVSATMRAAQFGARFYSRQVTVASGAEAAVDLSVDPGTITLTVTAVAGQGAIGAASIWLASGTITAKTLTELTLKLAAAGPGTSVRLGIAAGEPKQFTELAPGPYSVCITPLPLEVKGQAAPAYLANHSDSLATFCDAVTVAPSPDAQALQVPVELPPFVADDPGAGSGSGGRTPRRAGI